MTMPLRPAVNMVVSKSTLRFLPHSTHPLPRRNICQEVYPVFPTKGLRVKYDVVSVVLGANDESHVIQ